MVKPRWLQYFSYLRLEFWLPLPFLGLLFWWVSGWMTQQTFNRSHEQAIEIQVKPQQLPAQQVLLIKVSTNRDRAVSQVKVRTATTVIKEQTFELSTTETSQIEAVLSQKLNLSSEQIKKLVRYQVGD